MRFKFKIHHIRPKSTKLTTSNEYHLHWYSLLTSHILYNNFVFCCAIYACVYTDVWLGELSSCFKLDLSNFFKGNIISTPNVVISAPFAMEITNNSLNLHCYLLFSHQMVRK